MTSSRRVFLGIAASVGALKAKSADITDLTPPGALNNPYGIRTGPDKALYICEIGNHRISKLHLQTGKLTTVIDKQKEPYDLRFDRKGNLFFVDMPAHQVRRLDLKTGQSTVVAGTGEPGFSGDGGPAAQAQLQQPHSIAFDSEGNLLICDIGNHRLRRVNLATGIMDTFAGTGEKTATPDGAPRKGTPIYGPRAIDFDRQGNLLLVLREGNSVYRLDRKKDQFFHLAGNGEKGHTGDGGDARSAKLNGPKAIACAPDGSVYLADTESHTIRRVDSGGLISTVIGTGERGDGPVGDPLKCKLARPHGIFIDHSGIFIGDSENHRIRKLESNTA